jgi:hypothetical protein
MRLHLISVHRLLEPAPAEPRVRAAAA